MELLTHRQVIFDLLGMERIYWNVVSRNPYLMLQCENYEKRHGKTVLRKWWYLLKVIYKNRQHCCGTILKTEEVCRLVDSHDVVSFDIFDTLLIRPYKRPADLFFELEKREGSSGFGSKRIEAEKKTRERYRTKEEITLDQIYQEIGSEYTHLKNKEMELEEEILSVHPFVHEIYQYALSKGKKIVICSDMYLPQNFLESVLHKKGCHGFDAVYVSSEIMMTKASGNLFRYMLRDLSISNRSVLHIGDNLESDGNANILYGMTYICVEGSRFIQIEKTKRG